MLNTNTKRGDVVVKRYVFDGITKNDLFVIIEVTDTEFKMRNLISEINYKANTILITIIDKSNINYSNTKLKYEL